MLGPGARALESRNHQQRNGKRLRRYLEIVLTLAHRAFAGRYRGNLLGVVPALLVPVLFLLTYTFVFANLIPIRLRPEASRADYGFFLFAGLVGWNLFAEAVGQAPGLFRSQAHFVRKARFPASALVLASCLSAFYQSLIWVAVFAVAQLVAMGSFPPSILLAPLILASTAVFAAAVCLILSAVGAFMRDLGDLVVPFLTLGFFLSPVLYPLDRITAKAPLLAQLNPLAPLLEMLRATLLHGIVPDPASLLAPIAWCAGFLIVGVLIHLRVRPILADVV